MKRSSHEALLVSTATLVTKCVVDIPELSVSFFIAPLEPSKVGVE